MDKNENLISSDHYFIQKRRKPCIELPSRPINDYVSPFLKFLRITYEQVTKIHEKS